MPQVFPGTWFLVAAMARSQLPWLFGAKLNFCWLKHPLLMAVALVRWLVWPPRA